MVVLAGIARSPGRERPIHPEYVELSKSFLSEITTFFRNGTGELMSPDSPATAKCAINSDGRWSIATGLASEGEPATIRPGQFSCKRARPADMPQFHRNTGYLRQFSASQFRARAALSGGSPAE